MSISGLLVATLGLAANPFDPAALQRVGEVDPRYQSYNVEMVEVTGGRFWRPYRLGPPTSPDDRYAYRPPLDLANKRLVKLARALGPAYVRISGTWASATWVAPDDKEVTAPTGFNTILYPKQWRVVASFIDAIGGQVVLSAPTSTGTRDAEGVWQPTQLNALLALSATMKVPVAAASFMNEPNLIGATGAPANYTLADYGRDYTRFATAVRAASPTIKIAGPGAVGGASLVAMAGGQMKYFDATELARSMQSAPDIYNYHHYGSVSQRCATSGPLSTSLKDTRDPTWLARTDDTFAFHKGIRDQYAPKAPIWVTETAQAACGGSPWAATFVDTPRYIDQLGRLARQGVSAVFHNTLSASDYALLDETDFSPRPSYWAALLWGRLMGTKVLGLDSADPTLRLYAHCQKDSAGGVALIAINLTDKARSVSFKGAGQAYVLAGADNDRGVTLNGVRLALGKDDALPAMKGVAAKGAATIAPYGVTFVAIPTAKATACR